MEPCFLESFQRCWIAICVCGMSSLLSLCPRFETDVLILNDCTSTSCCVQSWSSFPALPADFYLKPAEELRHCGNGVEGRERRKNSLRVTNPGRPVSPGCLHWWREEGLFFLENSSESFRHWGMCTEGGCWEDRVPGGVTVTRWALISTCWTFSLTALQVGLHKHHCKNRVLKRNWNSVDVHRELLTGSNLKWKEKCCLRMLLSSHRVPVAFRTEAHHICHVKLRHSCPAMQYGCAVWETEELDLMTSRITGKGWMPPQFVSMRSLMKWE